MLGRREEPCPWEERSLPVYRVAAGPAISRAGGEPAPQRPRLACPGTLGRPRGFWGVWPAAALLGQM